MQTCDNNLNEIKRVLVIGGGSAGWLTACHLARRLYSNRPDGIQVTLIESEEIPTIGVGEGTVPAIRQSLQYLGISETDFIRECDAAFKQSIKFVDWLEPSMPAADNYYHHVFDYPNIDLTPYWLMDNADAVSYVNAVSIQGRICDQGLGPKTMTQPEFEGTANYAYHLDAAKFARLLTTHAVDKLGVRHLLANVQEVRLAPCGEIQSVVTDRHGEVTADVFIDCTGFAALLLGKTMGIDFIEKKNVLFADHALAMQVPYADEHAPIPGYTIATAREAGWIWDIGLSTRRGTGYVYSESHTSHERAEQVLRDYARQTIGPAAEALSCRRIPMRVGYREKFWHKNCVAIGLSQGFVEPLEATGLLVYDATAKMLAEQFPASKAAMPAIADKFNRRVGHAWASVIDFIKLHYYLSNRNDSDFWRDNRAPGSAPQSLLENLAHWRYHPPSGYDFSSRLEIFNLENYLYVLYGMGFKTDIDPLRYRYPEHGWAKKQFQRLQLMGTQASSHLLPHRELLDRIKKYGLQKI